MKRALWLLPLLFFSSGATALIYEVVWSKYLGLIFGSTVQAQATVLAIFMAGLALGNRLFARFADGLTRPVAAYGWIEIVIGFFALGFPFLYAVADGLFVRTGAGLLDQPQSLLLLKAALSVALLLGPTMLMGGTLPLMAAWLHRQGGDPGRRTAVFYAINSLGAVTGAGLAGFVLVHWFGLVWTLAGTGIANLVIGCIALSISRHSTGDVLPASAEDSSGPMHAAEPAEMRISQPADSAPSRGGPLASATVEQIEQPALLARGSADQGVMLFPVAHNPDTLETQRFFRKSCLLVFVVGAISLSLEILAARALSMIFGASIQAFSTMLMAFILGIGLGSMVISSPRMNRFVRESTIAGLLLAAAGSIALLLAMIEFWAAAYVSWRNQFGLDGGAYLVHLLTAAGISIVVLGIPAAFLGAILPLCIRLAGRTSMTLGNHVGRLLTWNTLGAVGGVLAAGFVMLPAFGLHASLSILAGVLCLAALVQSHHLGPAIRWCAGGVFLLAIVTALLSADSWQRVLNSGVFRWRETDVSAFQKIRSEFAKSNLLFYKDGADATVAVRESPLQEGGTQLIMTINGKPDASSHGDLSTQYLLAHLPMAARPGSREVFVLGFGSGITAGALLGHPLDRIVVAENCRPVLEAGRLFEPWNRGVLTNRVTEVFHEDARTVLKLSPRAYDLIISEPSNPWTAGIGSVFSVDFFELAASRLEPGGIMAQWFHMYETDDDVVFLVLRTFNSVFPHMEIWETQIGDIILLGSKQPWRSSPEISREIFARSQPRADLESIGLKTPEALWARQLASQSSSFAIAGPGPVQTDARPILEYAATRAFYRSQGAFGLFMYDERTLQSAFAPPEKRAALVALPDGLLRSVFERYPSGNPSLMTYYEWRTEAVFGSDGRGVYSFQPFLPLIFRPAESFPKDPPDAGGASPGLVRLLRAGTLISAWPDRWREGVADIEALLKTPHAPVLRPDESHWLAHFAAMAIKARFRHGDLSGAADMLARALAIDPHDPQLQYMDRVLRRPAAGSAGN